MVKVLVTSFSGFVRSLSGYTPPGLILSAASAFIKEGQYFGDWQHEFLGTLLMISGTFSAGKWIGEESVSVAWISHAVGVVAADLIGGGPHVNPAVTMSMWALGKVTYTDLYVRICGQMAGGLVAFPLFHALSEYMGWTPLGGPEFDPSDDEHGVEAFLSETLATLCLLFLIYLLNFELHFGKYHYWIKQPLTALGIRGLIELFPTAGPAMNPMLGTCWAVFGTGEMFEFPSDPVHYFVYWVGPFLAAIVASFMYIAYAGGTFFGHTLPFGPVKKAPVQAQPSAPPAASSSGKKDKAATKKE